MSAALVAVVRPWPKALGVALVIAVASFGTTPAFAAPEWGITMTHANAYGLQAGECPSGKEEAFPTEPDRDCGIDPFTGSGTTFSRESGFNTYTILATNIAKPAAGPSAGDTITCQPGHWEESPTLSYAWLRNDSLIAGAESSEYTLAAADDGKAVQCQVTAVNATATSVGVTNAFAVAPSPSTELPALAKGAKVSVPGEGTEGHLAGETLECQHGTWGNSPAFSYTWLRDGAPIPGAEAATYTLGASDLGTSVQCEVVAANAGGSVAAENEFFIYVGTGANPFPPYHEEGFPAIPVPKSSNETSGTVTVATQLPRGLILAGGGGQPAAFGEPLSADRRVRRPQGLAFVKEALSRRFFQDRFEMASDAERRYLAAMADLGDGAVRSADVSVRVGYKDRGSTSVLRASCARTSSTAHAAASLTSRSPLRWLPAPATPARQLHGRVEAESWLCRALFAKADKAGAAGLQVRRQASALYALSRHRDRTTAGSCDDRCDLAHGVPGVVDERQRLALDGGVRLRVVHDRYGAIDQHHCTLSQGCGMSLELCGCLL